MLKPRSDSTVDGLQDRGFCRHMHTISVRVHQDRSNSVAREVNMNNGSSMLKIETSETS